MIDFTQQLERRKFIKWRPRGKLSKFSRRFFRSFSNEIVLMELKMKSKYAKEYSNLKIMNVKVLKAKK